VYGHSVTIANEGVTRLSWTAEDIAGLVGI